DLGIRKLQRAADIEIRLLCLFRRLPIRLSDFGRVEIAISLSRGEQVFELLAIDVATLRLKIRTEGAADFGAFVPVEVEPAEGVENRSQCLLHVPLLVGV